MNVNLAELAKEIHAAAVEKGFWSVEDAVKKHIAKMHSELSEAVQADRAGIMYEIEHEGAKPEGVIAELADFVMMVLDMLETDGCIERVLEYDNLVGEDEREIVAGASLPDLVISCHAALVKMIDPKVNDEDTLIRAYSAIYMPVSWAEAHGFDLWKVIRVKMEYNKSRPALHGRAY